MSKKQPVPAPATDEWGIYDPSKAGMQALYQRLGRPVLRASAASERRARRRAAKSDRPADGVGLAIEEAKRRAAKGNEDAGEHTERQQTQKGTARLSEFSFVCAHLFHLWLTLVPHLTRRAQLFFPRLQSARAFGRITCASRNHSRSGKSIFFPNLR